MNGVLVTGTDTGVGKTVVTALLARHLAAAGRRPVTMKPVQTGCVEAAEDLLAHDRLLPAPGGAAPEDRCPYCFPLPASPHLAARAAGTRIDPARIEAAYRRLSARFDPVLVEGAGGALVPLAEDLVTADLAARLGLDAVVVVANRLGCVNHALLTVEALRRRGLPLLGLVFTRLAPPGDGDGEAIAADNPRIVAALAGVPVLGEVPFAADPLALPAAAFAPIGAAFLDALEVLRR